MQVSSSRLDFYMNRAIQTFLKHTYTWTDVDGIPTLDGLGQPTYDEWNNQIFTNSTPVEDKTCLFLWRDISIQTPDGITIIKAPTLYVPQDDPIDLGDTVTNVLAQDRETIILVSATVESVNGVSNLGPSVCKILTLSGATTV